MLLRRHRGKPVEVKEIEIKPKVEETKNAEIKNSKKKKGD